MNLKVKTKLNIALGREKKVIVQNLYSYFDVQYLENISKGIPGEKFRVFLDTGSSNFWVVDKSCLKRIIKNNTTSRDALSIYGGKLTYGAVNKDHCGPVIRYQIISIASYWQFTVRSVSINKLKYNHGFEAIADTGNQFIGAPPATVERIANILKGQFIQQIGLYFDLCRFNIFPHVTGGYSPAFSFGDPFHTSYCVIYDIGNKRIGFARPKR